MLVVVAEVKEQPHRVIGYGARKELRHSIQQGWPVHKAEVPDPCFDFRDQMTIQAGGSPCSSESGDDGQVPRHTQGSNDASVVHVMDTHVI